MLIEETRKSRGFFRIHFSLRNYFVPRNVSITLSWIKTAANYLENKGQTKAIEGFLPWKGLQNWALCGYEKKSHLY